MRLPGCQVCSNPFNPNDSRALHVKLRPLYGDLFFKYTCSLCGTGEATFERLPLSWLNIIQLVLYHLHRLDRSGVGFFRWKEDICKVIEDRWDVLCPSKIKTASWMNSVSSVLSANAAIFESGFGKLKQPGWWALKLVQPPGISLGPKKRRKILEEGGSLVDDSKGSGASVKLTEDREVAHEATERKPSDVPKLEVLGISQNASVQLADSFTIPPSRSPATVDTAQTLLLARHYVDRIPNVSALLPLEKEATPSTMKAAQEIKRKLVERLLRVDSKLLKEALANAPTPPSQLSLSGTSPSTLYTYEHPPPICTIKPDPGAVTEKKLNFTLPVNIADTQSTKDAPKKPASKPLNYVRASPHENELLDCCLRVMNTDSTINRFRRKLLMRRTKRKVGLPIFDIDILMYNYLKLTDPLVLPDTLQLPSQTEAKDMMDLDESSPKETKTFFDVPFHRDPSLSFKAKLLGITNVLEEYPPETVSPYSGLRLPSYLHREYIKKPQKMRLLEEIRQKVPLYDSKEDERYYPDSIDFLNIRKEWIPQVNQLLRKFFWNTIEISEVLDYLDYGIVVMYGNLVIGCTLMTPDGYVMYFIIHPEWEGAGLGSILLYLLLSKAAPSYLDLTLHVSANNPALLLYQKFGFKPEEYVVNFYDKYIRDDDYTIGTMQNYTKNAYFMRFRR